ncbi:glycoside hydrolase family 16 protein [Streptacidiphilus rugosus]|uniref:glycoside hydrolase family 16 protein n=1 Tax=Streptacidiphilus rugosus TaxID=405783 RepID=UPI0009FF6E04|nr:glycoside hydrolase family 16 protein [Streptacidiphilus rugosus]
MHPILSTPARILAFGATPALLLGAAFAPQAQAATPRVSETGLTATVSGTSATATVKVSATSCVTVRSLGVAVRDAAGRHLDFPQWRSNARICPTGLTVNAGTRTLAAGHYTMMGAYLDASGWHNLTAKTLIVGSGSTSAPAPKPTPTPTPTPAPAPSGGSAIPAGVASSSTPIWSEEFSNPISWGQRWVGDTSTAYRYGNHNPDDNKLDWLDTNDVSVANGVATFTAQPSSHTLENGKQAWTTGLLTTEGSKEGFQVRTGDYVEARVKLPTGTGAWPALWTWKNGNGEIDSFEYHPDNPNLLELTNHVTSGGDYYTDASAVKPGGWVTIGTKYGADSVDWYVNGVKVYSDGHGVGANWSAYLILNLSLSAGQYHAAPSGSTPITFSADYLRVYH